MFRIVKFNRWNIIVNRWTVGGTEVAGAISNSHTIASLTRSQDGAEVTCTATNSVGSSVMTSSVNITCMSNLLILWFYFKRSSLLTSLVTPRWCLLLVRARTRRSWRRRHRHSPLWRQRQSRPNGSVDSQRKQHSARFRRDSHNQWRHRRRFRDVRVSSDVTDVRKRFTESSPPQKRTTCRRQRKWSKCAQRKHCDARVWRHLTTGSWQCHVAERRRWRSYSKRQTVKSDCCN